MGIILGVLFVVGIVIFIIAKTAIHNTENNGIEYLVSKKSLSENNPKINDEVGFWHNERNNTINIYFKGSIGNSGLIGIINSKPDLAKYQKGTLNAYICNVTQKSVFIKFY